jgi:hypothetical protein
MQNPGVLRFVIKKWQMAIKFRITIEEPIRFIQKLLVVGFETKMEISHFAGFGGQSRSALRIHPPCPPKRSASIASFRSRARYLNCVPG